MIVSFWHWLIMACILFIAELVVPITFCLWLGLACVVMGIYLFFGPNLLLINQLIIFAALTCLSIILTLFVKNKIYLRRPSRVPDTLNKRQQHWIGHTFILKHDIINNHSREQFGDSTWSIQGPNLKAGTRVTVINSQGTTLIVDNR